MAHIVAWGDTQITGVDFTNNYLPVVYDVTMCTIMLMWLMNKWDPQFIFYRTWFYIKPQNNRYAQRYQWKWQREPKKNICTVIYCHKLRK